MLIRLLLLTLVFYSSSCGSKKTIPPASEESTTGFPLALPGPAPEAIHLEVEILAMDKQAEHATLQVKVVKIIARGNSAPNMSPNDELNLTLNAEHIAQIRLALGARFSLEASAQRRMGDETSRLTVLQILP